MKQFHWLLCVRYLTIRLLAPDFYEVIVDEEKPESTITLHRVTRERDIKHKVLYKNIEKRQLKALKNAPGKLVFDGMIEE